MEYLLVDKTGDNFYFKDLKEIAEYLNLTKSQINNEVYQSLKHYNLYTNRGIYIQRLYNNPVLHKRKKFDCCKYIYYIDSDGEKYASEFILQ